MSDYKNDPDSSYPDGSYLTTLSLPSGVIGKIALSGSWGRGFDDMLKFMCSGDLGVGLTHEVRGVHYGWDGQTAFPATAAKLGKFTPSKNAAAACAKAFKA